MDPDDTLEDAISFGAAPEGHDTIPAPPPLGDHPVIVGPGAVTFYPSIFQPSNYNGALVFDLDADALDDD
jgi:hypothetical protein